jgi:hypothetical protein
MKGIDCASKITKEIAEQLAAEGYCFACRYHVPKGYEKRLTEDEAKMISAAGLEILSIFETYANRALEGASAGEEDGAAALKVARELKVPESAIIYFAVDFDAQSADMDAIEAYLRAAKDQTTPYDIGVYGSYSVIEEMAKRYACKGFWQTYAWSYDEKSAYMNVYQYSNGEEAAGIEVDFNEAESLVGMWSYSEEVEEVPENPNGNTPSDWAQEACDWAVEKGIFTGDENGNMHWQDPVTREELAVILYRLLG